MVKQGKQNVDLTQGNIWIGLILFFIPILASSLFQQLYTTVDAVIIGQFVGKSGLAAIDSVYNLIKLPVNFFVGLSSGATIIISQFFGAKKNKDLSDAVHTAVAFAFIGGLLLSMAGVAFTPYYLKWLDVPEDLFSTALTYVRVYFAGLSVSMVYNIGAGILRAVGDSKTPFKYLVIANTANVALDGVFVIALGWGVAGTALSTVLAQLISAVLIISALTKTKLACKLELKHIKIQRPMLKSIFMLGIPIALQSSLYPIANMIIQSSINITGTDNIAAWALCGKLDFMIWLVTDSLAVAISTFTAQNFGAKQYQRLGRGVWIGVAMTLGIILAISTVLFLWSEPLARLFIRASDTEVISLAGSLMRFLSPLYFLYVFGEMLSGAIRGTGETFKPMLLTLLCTCAFRILWILLILPQNHTLMAIITVYPVSWGITSLCFIVYYFFVKKKIFAGNTGAVRDEATSKQDY